MDKRLVSKDYIYTCLKEYEEEMKKPGKEGMTRVLESALFIEEIFEIVLTDEEICTENLGSYKNLENFVRRKIG